MRGFQPALRGGFEIAAVGRDHHALVRFEIECFRGREINAGLRLVIAGDFGAQDRVPMQMIAAREVSHQRDVSVRHRREQKIFAQARKAGGDVRPGIEPMPGEIEVFERPLVGPADREPRQDPFEIHPVQHVELRERNFS